MGTQAAVTQAVNAPGVAAAPELEIPAMTTTSVMPAPPPRSPVADPPRALPPRFLLATLLLVVILAGIAVLWISRTYAAPSARSSLMQSKSLAAAAINLGHTVTTTRPCPCQTSPRVIMTRPFSLCLAEYGRPRFGQAAVEAGLGASRAATSTAPAKGIGKSMAGIAGSLDKALKPAQKEARRNPDPPSTTAKAAPVSVPPPLRNTRTPPPSNPASRTPTSSAVSDLPRCRSPTMAKRP